ncbi:MafI family immunity protein [Streptomyces sp. NPDC005395]|uniref:MafI family immunity protein n=1 Tax=unclassified Streptomyces TaxID=2593676 RepID=UPI0013CA56F3|nr:MULTISPECIES: MafI family immunity protein [unclassified Streptomyces]NDZ70313.1 MafI family immunity protein [Streptomyces sp. SID10362]
MERYQYLRALISQLLEESPLTSEEVIADVRHLINVGEEELAFDTMCSWIYEDSLAITSVYYERLAAAAQELGTPKSTERLDELVEG